MIRELGAKEKWSACVNQSTALNIILHKYECLNTRIEDNKFITLGKHSKVSTIFHDNPGAKEIFDLIKFEINTSFDTNQGPMLRAHAKESQLLNQKMFPAYIIYLNKIAVRRVSQPMFKVINISLFEKRLTKLNDFICMFKYPPS